MVKEAFSEGNSVHGVARRFEMDPKAIPCWKKSLEKLHAQSWLESTVTNNQLKRTVHRGRKTFRQPS